MAIEVFKLFGSIMVDNEKANKSISETDKKAEGLGSKFISGVGTAAKWGAAIVGAAAAGAAALGGMAVSAAGATDRIDKMSQKMGLSRETFQEFDFIASQSGTSVEQLQTGMRTLTGLMDSASEGSETAVKTFEKLNLTWDDGNGKLKSQEQMFEETVTALQNMEDGTEKARLATEIFGRSGMELMPLLNGAAGSVEEMKEKAHELGLVLNDEAIDSGVQFTDTMDQLKRSFQSVTTKIGVEVMPIFQSMCDWVISNMPTIQAVFEAVFNAIEWGVTFVSGILNTFFTELTNGLSNSGVTWETVWAYCQEIWNGFVTVLKTLWDTVGQPLFELIVNIIGWVKDIFMEYWPMISGFFATFVNDVKTLWGNNLKPILDAIGNFIQNVLAPAFQFVFENIIGPVVGACFKGIIDLWNNSLKPIFQGITDFIAGVFTGNWSRAWEGIVSVVDGIFGGIVSVVKAPINAVIGIINKFIGGLNKLKVPDWLPLIGGKSINIPKIPMLAKGTNYFSGSTYGNMAIVGEQGPELINLPNGAKVNTASETKDMLNGGTFIIQSVLDGRIIAETIAPYSDLVSGQRLNLTERGVLV